MRIGPIKVMVLSAFFVGCFEEDNVAPLGCDISYDTIDVCDLCDLTVDWSDFSAEIEGGAVDAVDIQAVSISVFDVSEDELIEALCKGSENGHFVAGVLLPANENFSTEVPLDVSEIMETHGVDSDTTLTFTLSLTTQDNGLITTQFIVPGASADTDKVSY